MKKYLGIIVGIILVLILGIMVFLLNQRNDKEEKAKEIFGEENCEALLHMATKDLVEHTCQICGEKFQDSGMRADICTQCANETGRCEFCGKKLSEEVKEQRNEILNQ